MLEYLLELTAVRYPESATYSLIEKEPQLHATLPRQRLKMARELRRHTTLRTGLECLGVDAANLASLSIPASPSNLFGQTCHEPNFAQVYRSLAVDEPNIALG